MVEANPEQALFAHDVPRVPQPSAPEDVPDAPVCSQSCATISRSSLDPESLVQGLEKALLAVKSQQAMPERWSEYKETVEILRGDKDCTLGLRSPHWGTLPWRCWESLKMRTLSGRRTLGSLVGPVMCVARHAGAGIFSRVEPIVEPTVAAVARTLDPSGQRFEVGTKAATKVIDDIGVACRFALHKIVAPPKWEMPSNYDEGACHLCLTEPQRNPSTDSTDSSNGLHHCRNCCHLVCGVHSNHNFSIPWLGWDQKVRVCNACVHNVKLLHRALGLYEQIEHL
eukprot:gnl/MRDRNA2_/MRDRNA2_79330_c0_seq1.p1 gnl/MRDRNA2_/MRDRNA2_79330_c0~~gnl/MRDRNA2_/MRDRNA2_79330_c0_seq1.p1  ORF type:complete len:317 (-),score=31.85 gnl/MRDRNA2_/MRDRNA2_79330_c0_seq1:239-1087(-)